MKRAPSTRQAGRKVAMMLIVSVVVAAAAAAILARDAWRGAPQAGSSPPLTMRVEQFYVLGTPVPAFDARAFAGSLAARLVRITGMRALVDPGGVPPAGAAEYRLGGTVERRDSRFMLTARLTHRDDTSAVWTGSFWRSEESVHTLVQDVAEAVVEALYSELGRRAFAAKEQSR